MNISTLLTTRYLQDIEEQEQADALAYLAQKTAANEFVGIEIHSVVIFGSVSSSLLRVVQREHIDLIVLCSHGETGFKRWTLGSVVQKVARQSPVPVLLLQDQNQNLKDSVVQPVRAAVALDGSTFGEAVLLPAAQVVTALSFPTEGELLLLRVVKRPMAWEERACWQRGRDVDLRQAMLRVADDYLQTEGDVASLPRERYRRQPHVRRDVRYPSLPFTSTASRSISQAPPLSCVPVHAPNERNFLQKHGDL